MQCKKNLQLREPVNISLQMQEFAGYCQNLYAAAELPVLV
jgi:hypothetical protein